VRRSMKCRGALGSARGAASGCQHPVALIGRYRDLGQQRAAERNCLPILEPIRRTWRKSSSYSSGRNLTMTLTVRPALSSVSVIQYPTHIGTNTEASHVATSASIKEIQEIQESSESGGEAFPPQGQHRPAVRPHRDPIMKTSGLSTGRRAMIGGLAAR
jgi:hypothetical protein